MTCVSVIFKMWGGIVKDRLNVVSVYLLKVFMVFTCLIPTITLVFMIVCVMNSCPSNVRVYWPFIVTTFR